MWCWKQFFSVLPPLKKKIVNRRQSIEMSSHEKIPFELNLLLKQQNVKQIENQFEIKYESFSLKAYEGIGTPHPEDLTDEKRNLALTLTKWHINENSFYTEFKSTWERYESLKKKLECIYHYSVCVKLTSKATKELADVIINLGRVEGNSEAFEEIDSDTMEQSILELIQDNEIRTAWNELEAYKKDYDIATKNFKILLEIIDFSSDDLDNLKKQYNDVFHKYQHARSRLETELPVLLGKMKEIFYNCLHLLSGNVKGFIICTTSLDDLIKDVISHQIQENKTEKED